MKAVGFKNRFSKTQKLKRNKTTKQKAKPKSKSKTKRAKRSALPSGYLSKETIPEFEVEKFSKLSKEEEALLQIKNEMQSLYEERIVKKAEVLQKIAEAKLRLSNLQRSIVSINLT